MQTASEQAPEAQSSPLVQGEPSGLKSVDARALGSWQTFAWQMRPSAQFPSSLQTSPAACFGGLRSVPEDRYSRHRTSQHTGVLDAFLASTVEADIGLAFDLAIGVVVTVWVVRLTSG